MHRIGWVVQNLRALGPPLLSAPKLSRGSALGTRRRDDPNSASGGLPVVVNPDKKGRLLETEQRASAETAKI